MLLYKKIFGNIQPRHLVELIPADDDWVTLNVDGAVSSRFRDDG